MANGTSGGGLHYPNVDFSWLGELPGLVESARIRQGQASTLAGMEDASPEELYKRAAKLASIGDLEGFKLLHSAAVARQEVQRKTAADTAYERILPYILKGMGGLPSGVPGVADVFTAPATSAPATTAPGGGYPWSSVPIPSVSSGPQSALPPAPGEPSPGDQLLNLAQAAVSGGGAPLPGLTRLAQLGPGLPSTGGPAQALPPSLPWGAGAMAPAWTAPPAPPPPLPEPAPGLPVQEAARQRVDAIAQIMAGVPPKAPGAIQALRSQMIQALPATKLNQEDINWYTENFDRRAQGLPPIRRSDYKAQEAVQPEEFKSALKTYEEVAKGMRESQKIKSDMDVISTIVNHPKFESGAGTAYFNYGKGLVRNLLTTVQNAGIPVPAEVADKINNATSSVPVREGFEALVNSSTFAKLGNLGNQTSDSDRKFVTAIFPSLNSTVEGNKLLTEYFQGVTQKNIELERAVRAQYGPRMNPAQLSKTIDDFWSDPNNSLLIRNGELTPLGKRIEALASGTGGGGGGSSGSVSSGTIMNVPWSRK